MSQAPIVYRKEKSPETAASIELIGGFFQMFGLGHMYLGNMKLGFTYLLGYWLILVINAVLIVVGIGLITLPLSWFAMMLISSLVAANSGANENRARRS